LIWWGDSADIWGPNVSIAPLGYLDLQLAILQAKLPGVAHSTVTAPLARIWHELARTDGICFLGASVTEERLKLGLFSKRGINTPIIQLATRADFIFIWPEQLTYDKRSVHSDLATASYKISGTSDSQPYYVACSKGPLGQKAIAKIDAALAHPAGWRDFIAPLKAWFPPEDFARAERGSE
jgi:hypothetical protein